MNEKNTIIVPDDHNFSNVMFDSCVVCRLLVFFTQIFLLNYPIEFSWHLRFWNWVGRANAVLILYQKSSPTSQQDKNCRLVRLTVAALSLKWHCLVFLPNFCNGVAKKIQIREIELCCCILMLWIILNDITYFRQLYFGPILLVFLRNMSSKTNYFMILELKHLITYS